LREFHLLKPVFHFKAVMMVLYSCATVSLGYIATSKHEVRGGSFGHLKNRALSELYATECSGPHMRNGIGKRISQPINQWTITMAIQYEVPYFRFLFPFGGETLFYIEFLKTDLPLL